MATAEEHKVALKLLVHPKENKVIFAEADNHFADILFSFLTMPLGTIIRLVGEESDVQPAGLKVGSLSNLYKSVSDLDRKFFSTWMSKRMLLFPRNDAELECQRLKVNIAEAAEYFRCRKGRCDHISTCDHLPCRCGRQQWVYCSMNSSDQGAVFFDPSTVLMIGDDLHIMPSGPRIMVELFSRFGITDVKLLSEKVVYVGKNEILNLLKCSMTSKTPLTDAFLKSTSEHQPPQVTRCEPSNIILPPKVEYSPDNSQQFSLKLLVRKSDKKVLFAQANDDFINQIFSLLAVPLGMVVRLLGGNSSLGSVDELYTSINQDLGTYINFRNPPAKNKLMHPKLTPHFSSKKQLLPLPIAEYKDVTISLNGITRHLDHALCSSCANGGAFVKSPTAFIVTDDLVVKPISSLSSVTFLESLDIPNNGIEEKVVEFGIDQAYKLLKCSLLTESALTHALMVDLLKTPKKEK